MEHVVVEKHSMRVLAVVAKCFAVICGNDDQGVGAGGLDQPAGSAIDGGDLTVVRRRCESAASSPPVDRTDRGGRRGGPTGTTERLRPAPGHRTST